jgi:filamentous hemagglutinin
MASIYKRVAGNLIIETIGASDTVTFQGLVANAAEVIINGDLSVTGNASLTGNIAGDNIFNGTTSIEIPVASGNALVTVGGTPNVAVFSNTGVAVTGTLSASGAIAGSSTISATGNITGANLNTAGNVWITRDAGVSQPTIRFVDTDNDVSDGQVFGAVEWFTSDASSTGPRVTAGIRAVAAGLLGNANVQILTSTGGAAATPKVTVDNIGNVGIANAAPLHTLAVSGTVYGSSTITAVGNITGGNIVTGGQVTAVGNISTDANAVISGFAVVTGNVTAGNLITSGGVTAGGAGVSATGNVRGGNVVSDGSVSATGNVSASNFFASEDVVASGNVDGNNISVTNNLNTSNIFVTGSSSGTGIGVDNTVWQNTTVVIEPTSMSNVGVLAFSAVENQSYKFVAILPVVPEGSTTSEFALQFSSGTCNYLVEAQETATSLFSATASTTSDSGISRTMTGTNLRFVRITGTFFHTGNVDVAVRSSTSAANLDIQAGAYITYTRIA